MASGNEGKPTLAELTDLFRELGAPDPSGWAKSQFEEGIQQLARFSFLKAAWASVVGETDLTWIERELEFYRNEPDVAGAGAGRALSRLMDLGANAGDVTELVRTMQWRTLLGICELIDNCTDGYQNPWNPEEHWHLMLHENCPLDEADVGGLHESILELDPTGREMRPRSES